MSDSGVNDVGVHNALKFHKTEGDSFAKIKTQAATTNQEPTADQATKVHLAPNTDQTAKAHQEPKVDTASKAHQTAKADIATEADTSQKKTQKSKFRVFMKRIFIPIQIFSTCMIYVILVPVGIIFLGSLSLFVALKRCFRNNKDKPFSICKNIIRPTLGIAFFLAYFISMVPLLSFHGLATRMKIAPFYWPMVERLMIFIEAHKALQTAKLKELVT